MKFLITGNTGFKGAWLSLILKNYGHEVVGVALPAEDKSLFNVADVIKDISKQFYLDIRNQDDLKDVIKKENPEILVHFAAQPLVRESYSDPRKTIETNVLGTYNVLESLNLASNLQGTLVITTDKVYKNLERFEGYSEEDALGGDDPYSASKAMADLLTQSWVKSFSGPPIQIVRAGNVIGGGDFSKDRLIPDIVRAIENSTSVSVRYPNSIRPWQHVFDCLGGYLKLLDYSLDSKKSGIWNVGPDPDSLKSVTDVINVFNKYLPFNHVLEKADNLHESGLLTLNSHKIESMLDWQNHLNFENTIDLTASWYSGYLSGRNMREFSIQQMNIAFQDKEYIRL